MKKHLFTLIALLALVLVSGSAWAQATTFPLAPAAMLDGSPGKPKIYLTGATGTLSITKELVANTVAWALFKGTDATTPATSTALPAQAADLDTRPNVDWDEAQADALGLATSTFYFKWTDNASGAYYLQVTETNAHNCSTVRGYHIFIIGFDVEVYASDANGNRTADADLDDCGTAAYPAFMNNVSLNATGLGLRGDILNSATPGLEAPTDGSLANVHGTGPRTVRNYTAEITYDIPAQGTFANPTPASITLDIAVAGTNVAPVDVYSINTTATTVLAEGANNVATANINVGATANKFTFSVDLYERWGIDLHPTVEVHNVTLYAALDHAGTSIGEEPLLYEDIDVVAGEPGDRKNNLSNAWEIFGKPETSPITAP